jgi:hypothetical protein
MNVKGSVRRHLAGETEEKCEKAQKYQPPDRYLKPDTKLECYFIATFGEMKNT